MPQGALADPVHRAGAQPVVEHRGDVLRALRHHERRALQARLGRVAAQVQRQGAERVADPGAAAGAASVAGAVVVVAGAVSAAGVFAAGAGVAAAETLPGEDAPGLASDSIVLQPASGNSTATRSGRSGRSWVMSCLGWDSGERKDAAVTVT